MAEFIGATRCCAADADIWGGVLIFQNRYHHWGILFQRAGFLGQMTDEASVRITIKEKWMLNDHNTDNNSWGGAFDTF